jgi:hypothetical protein
MELDFLLRSLRARAIAHGYLIDVTDNARQVGLTVPVALTVDCWFECIAAPGGGLGQEETDRLSDLLLILHLRMSRLLKLAEWGELPSLKAGLLFHANSRKETKKPGAVELLAVFGNGDNAEPVITILLSDEQ